ncbi:MAG: glycosyltransferase family 2 protein [Desulfamplus sp.]|nr:glycosyltransferase family 2 protein [Desulfamplus sp.]
MDRVSIIIINYNGAQHLEENLLSLRQLDYPQDYIELIVFDNGSKDNSIEIINKCYPDAKIIRSNCNTGFAQPHAIASKEATGNVLAFLNNDMKVDSCWLKNGISMLKSSENIVCVSSKIMNWTGDSIDFCGGTLQYLGFADQFHDDSIKNGDEILFPCGGSMFIYRDVFIEAGFFDEDYFAIFEDVDLGWRLWVMGYRVVMATNSIVYHKGHGTLDTKKESKKRYLMHRNAMMTLIKNYSDENLNRILPLALIFAVKRSLLFMGINKKSYYFWEADLEDSTLDNSSKIFEQKADNLSNKALSNKNVPDNYEEACIHLAALDDVFTSFKALSEKREHVQSMRKRADEEIFQLFKDPFRNIMGYRDYLWNEVSLFGKFALDDVFKCSKAYSRRVEDGNYHARQMMEEMVDKCRCNKPNTFLSQNSDNNVNCEQVILNNNLSLSNDNLLIRFIRHVQNHGLLQTGKKMVNRLLS